MMNNSVERIACENKAGNGLSIHDYGAVCKYSARPGYKLSGSPNKTCEADGHWYGNFTLTSKY